MPRDLAGNGLTYEEAAALAKMREENAVPTFCAMCGPGSGCGIYAFTRNGRLARVAGMAEAPSNKGGLCPKAHASAEWLYSPDRLTVPLQRTGEKGEGKFREITWDEALDIIADKLKAQKRAYGPESLGLLSPAGRPYNDLSRRFMTVHGSPNYGHSGICAMQKAFAFSYTIGSYPTCDYKNSDLIIYWARNPIFAGQPLSPASELVSAKKRKATIVSIKPAIEPDAGMADIWIPIRPGTDAALALAMLNTIIGEDLIDKPFVEKWCYGFAPLAEHVKQYPPEWAESVTGVPADLIRSTARLYATTKAAVIDLGNGIEHTPSSNDVIRAVSIMMAITGHLDRPGCNLLAAPPDYPSPRSMMLRDRYTKEMLDKNVGPEFPIAFQPFQEGITASYYKVIESVLTEKPYPVRTLLAPGSQPTVSNRGTKQVIEALRRVEFFVQIDVMRTAEMNFADIVLPTTTPYESDYPFANIGNWLMARRKVAEPPGSFKSIWDFWLELAVRMGYGADFWNGDMTAFQNYRLEPYGITVGQLNEHPTGIIYPAKGQRIYENYEAAFSRLSFRFAKDQFLPQGKVALYNTLFEQEGFTPMPVWREPPESLAGTPELARKYPLALSDYHTTKSFTASWLRNIPSLREIQEQPTVHIHPQTAAARGIADGDWVRVESPHGWLKLRAEYYPGIRPDTVMIQRGWWQGCVELGLEDMPVADGGANVQNLYSVDPDKVYDPLVTAISSQTLVEVSKYE